MRERLELIVQYKENTGIIKRYNIPIDKAEGIAVDTAKKIIYIVRESNSKLYIYKYLD